MNELRSTPRTRALKGGRIVYDDGSVTRDCMVRNISAGGAKIVTENTIGIPDKFLLLFEDGGRQACSVRWRKMSELGVQFIDSDG